MAAIFDWLGKPTGESPEPVRVYVAEFEVPRDFDLAALNLTKVPGPRSAQTLMGSGRCRLLTFWASDAAYDQDSPTFLPQICFKDNYARLLWRGWQSEAKRPVPK